MTEIERLATVADRIASERLHSAVLSGKLPAENGCRRSYGRPELSSSDAELEKMEACFAGLSISGSRPTRRLSGQQRQDFASWCGDRSSSVSEELCRLPSNSCSSYVQFVPKSATVPCAIGADGPASDVRPSGNCRKPSVDSVVAIECQCGATCMAGSEPVLPIFDASVVQSPRDGTYSLVSSQCHPYAGHSAVSKSASQPTGVSTQAQRIVPVTADPKQSGEVDRYTSDACRVRQKPVPPPKVFRQSSTNSFREGLVPATAGVVDNFRIRRQAAASYPSAPQSGPMKATVPSFLKQPNDLSYPRSSAEGSPLPPPPPPTRCLAAADVGGGLWDAEARGMTLQELSAMVDRELRENERLEMDPDVDEETRLPPAARITPKDVDPPAQGLPSTADVIQSKVDVDARLTSFGFVETRQPLNATCARTISNDDNRSVRGPTSVDFISPSTGAAAAQSKVDVDARLKDLGFDDDIWDLQLDEGETSRGREDDEEDSASTSTDCSVVTVTAVTVDGRPGVDRDRPRPPNDALVSGDPSFFRPSGLGSGSSHSLPAISDAREASRVEADPSAHPRCSSTNIPVSRTCGEDARGRHRQPVGVPFNQLKSAAAAAPSFTHSSPYQSTSSGIGSLLDSGSVPNSPM